MSRLPGVMQRATDTARKWKLSAKRQGELLRLVKAAFFQGKADAYEDTVVTVQDQASNFSRNTTRLAENNQEKARQFLEKDD